MIQNKKIEGSASVPFLGRIPLLGVLFRSRSEAFNTEETVVFLTPRIITGEKPVLLGRDREKALKPPRTAGRVQRVEASAEAPASETRP
jgi:type II secretory pathway component GspD/PulD (secretin)